MDFTSHLAFTINNFSNKPHTHNNSSPWTFAMWIPVLKNTGKMVCNNFEVKGGGFNFPAAGCFVDFEGFNGVFEVVWKANQYEHHTLPSSLPQNSLHTRLGLSCQLPKRSQMALERICDGFYDQKPDWTFRDMDKILKSSSSKLSQSHPK